MRARAAGAAALLAAVHAAGAASLAAAAVAFAADVPSLPRLLELAALLAAAAVAEAHPIPLATRHAGRVSLAFVFAAAAVVLFGWPAATLLLVAGAVAVRLAERRPGGAVAFDAAVFATATVAAGLVAPLGGNGLARVVPAFAAVAGVSWLLAALAQGARSRRPLLPLLAAGLRELALPWALMASAAVALVALWQRSPALSLALAGPLLAIVLYQRSAQRELRALRLALTDSVTGLGNRREFDERLASEVAAARAAGARISLCLLDVDDLKRVNDRFGHPVGDRVLVELATRLRHGGEAFRLGGDEFAVLLPGYDEDEAHAVAHAIVDRIRSLPVDGISVTASAGVGTLPPVGLGADELVRLADDALYWAKEHGKNQVRAYRANVVDLVELRRLARGAEHGARRRAAVRLARAVDARDAYTTGHSQRVAALAARLAERLGADREQIELARLAGGLHDLGKLAVPKEILRKPGPLSERERRIVERHPQTAFRMLGGAGVERVATWVLHHHERWDGSGYPHGLEGDEIPLGARILFVADSYDAMTSERVYCARLSPQDAVAELRRCSGSQFDPRVVAALEAELGLEDDREAAVAS